MKIDRKFSLAGLQKHRLSILFVIAALLGLWAVHTFWFGPTSFENAELHSQVEQQEQLIQKYRGKLEQAQGLKEKLEKQEEELKQLQKGLFQGTDPYQLAASMGERFSSKGSDVLNIKSYQVLDSKEYGTYQEVRLKFYFMSTIQGLYHFLQSLDETQTVISVDQMDIRKGGGGSSDLVVNVILAALMERGDRS